jgi:zinc protease
MVRKSLVSSLLAASLTFVPAIATAGNGAECHQGQLTTQAVIDKHLKAVGGKERLQAAKTLQSTSVSKEGDTVTTSTMIRARPNLVRHDSEKDGVKTRKVFDGKQGWIAEGSAAAQPMGQEKSAMMAENAAFDDVLLDPKARGTAVNLDGVEEVNGAPAFKLVLTRGANTETRFIDQKSFLEVKRTYVGTHEGKAYNKSLSFSDFRSVDGITMSHRVQWEADGKKGEKVIQSARYDAPIDAATFTLATPRS